MISAVCRKSRTEVILSVFDRESFFSLSGLAMLILLLERVFGLKKTLRLCSNGLVVRVSPNGCFLSISDKESDIASSTEFLKYNCRANL